MHTDIPRNSTQTCMYTCIYMYTYMYVYIYSIYIYIHIMVYVMIQLQIEYRYNDGPIGQYMPSREKRKRWEPVAGTMHPRAGGLPSIPWLG